MKNVIDTSLIASIKKGNQDAFKVMYQSSIRYVYAIVNRYVSNESDHKDVIQEIFARIFLSIKTYDANKGDFKFWLRRLVINQCIQHYRKKGASGKIVPLESASEMETEMNARFDSLTKDEIIQYLTNMPDGYKQVFMMVVIDDYSHQEVSEILKISPETSRSQLSRGKKWLRENLSNNELKFLVSGV